MADPAALAPQALEAWAGEQSRMWTFITQLLVTLVLLGFFLVSCQNVAHIVRGSLGFVLKHVHQELDKELGESEGLSDDEETISTRVVRRRVLLKVTQGGVGAPGVPDRMPHRKRGRAAWLGGTGDVQAGAGRHFPALPNPRPSQWLRRLRSVTQEAGPPPASVHNQLREAARPRTSGRKRLWLGRSSP